MIAASSDFAIATLFAGGEGVGVGARSVGVAHLWGVERDTTIASVAERNGFQSIVADVRDVAFASLPRPDALHASPPCLSFSQTNRRGGETSLDRALASAIARAIRDLAPRLFTLENVPAYRASDSFRIITRALDALDYHIETHILDAADFGVPQYRTRLFVIARRGATLLPPLALERKRRTSWHDAIADLVPSFPLWPITPKVEQRLNKRRLTFPSLISHRIMLSVFGAHRPAQTITTKPDLGLLLDANTRLRLTPRAVARLQSFPDDYMLPERETLAWRIVGNAVPPRLYAAILAAALETM